MFDRFMESFKEETQELLDELETSLLELERFPSDSEAFDRVFPAMHTIKGLGSSFGFEKNSGFSHEVENVFALVRNGMLTVDRELIDLTLRARDWIRDTLEGCGGKSEAEGAALIESFRRISKPPMITQRRTAVPRLMLKGATRAPGGVSFA